METVHKYQTGTVVRNSSIKSFHFGSGEKHQARIAHEKKIQRFGKSPFFLFLFCILHFSPLSVICGIAATWSSSKVRLLLSNRSPVLTHSWSPGSFSLVLRNPPLGETGRQNSINYSGYHNTRWETAKGTARDPS